MIMESHLWQNILQLAQLSTQYATDAPGCGGISIKGAGAFYGLKQVPKEIHQFLLIGIFQDPPKGAALRCRLEPGGWIHFLHNKDEEPELQKLLSLYLPLALSPILAHRRKKALAVAHFAQTLDGKIATNTGASKWIGNEANLEHAHRMRALCDAILVGTNTVRKDRPQLTVRRVTGKNPTRVVLGKSLVDYSSLLESSPEQILLIGANKCPDHPQLLRLKTPESKGHLEGSTILKVLFQHGISSVLVEGGPQTTSNLLKDGALHLIQLHFSPMIFGSGKNCLNLPEIFEVNEGLGFQHHFFSPIGNGQMFTGYLQ